MAQKSLITIMQMTARELSIPVPSTAVSSQDKNIAKLMAFVQATCEDLLNEHDWQHLVKRYSFTTVAGQEEYTLPDDLHSFINGTAFDKNNRWPLVGPVSASTWEWLQNVPTTGPFEKFRVFGNTLHLSPSPADGLGFVFEYISRNYVLDGGMSGTTKGEFTQDSDIITFDHRLVIYGTKAKWLASIGQDNTDTVNEFRRTLEAVKGRDTPAARLTMGRGGGFRLLSTANYSDGNWSV